MVLIGQIALTIVGCPILRYRLIRGFSFARLSTSLRGRVSELQSQLNASRAGDYNSIASNEYKMQAEMQTAKRSYESTPNTSLFELLELEYSVTRNYQEKSFVSLAAAQRVLTRDRISEWIVQHPLYVETEDSPKSFELIDEIRASSCLLFVALILANLEYLTSRLLAHGFTDALYFNEESFVSTCKAAKLTDTQTKKLATCRNRLGVVLDENIHHDIPIDWVLPYLKRENVNRAGSYGVIYQVTVAPGHLKGYDKTVVAEKQIRGRSGRSTNQWQKLLREVETLRQRRHPSIIPLLGSYDLEMFESDDYFKTLHLIFPWAEMDLASWMIRRCVPENLENHSRLERSLYLYRSIYCLASGVSYLHKEIKGIATSHHDLKPKNILVVDGQFKIADFGRSHLRLTTDGSATGAATEVGTFEYRPPEYWNEDGSRADVLHGRAFDVWALGCIIIELAILIVHGWESGKLSDFRNKRMQNTEMEHQIPEFAPNGVDDSFCNNWVVVTAWVEQMRHDHGSYRMKEVLDIALQMMAVRPKNRVYMWEAEMDLNKILSPHDDRIPKLAEKNLCDLVPLSPVQYHIGTSPYEQRSNIPEYTQTPLHRAVQKGNRKRVVWLWALGWYLTLKNPDGDTPLDLLKRSDDVYLCELEGNVTKLLEAAKNDDVQTIRNLCSKHSILPLMVDINGCSALHLAISSGQAQAFDCLLECYPVRQFWTWDRASGKLPLHKAAQYGFVKGLVRILKDFHDVDIPSQTSSGGIDRTNTALYLAATHCKIEAAKVLLQHGAHLSPPYLEHIQAAASVETPIHGAVDRGDNEMVMLLLQAKDAHKCLDRENAWGQTPLLRAIKRGDIAICEALIQHGASLHVVSAEGQNVVHSIAELGLHELLRQHINKFSETELIAPTHGGQTPLMIAKDLGHKDVVRLLKNHLNNLHCSTDSTLSSGSSLSLSSRNEFRRMNGIFKGIFRSS